MASESILVVDDEPEAREPLVAMLSAEGYRVLEASDGAQALAVLERDGSVDLVLTDLDMPGMGGVALLKEIRRSFPATGVVVFSGVGQESLVVACLQAGALDYLPKPLSRAVLTVAVRGALRGRHVPLSGLDVQHGKDGWLELTADSELETVERFRSFVERLAASRMPPAVLEDLSFALSELGRNAVEWGNGGRKGRRLALSYCLLEDKVLLKVEDEGEGFSPDEVVDPAEDPIASLSQRRQEGKRAGGFGIHLVRRMMDEVLYSERGNVVIMAKRLGEPEGRA